MIAVEVEADVRALRSMNINALRGEWRRRGWTPPRVRSGELMRRMLACRLQENAMGADPELDKKLRALGARAARGQAIGAPRLKIKAGTVLIREHAGVRHRVEAVAAGFEWNGAVHASLSTIAREITGVRWSGPAFFGLRDAKP